MDRLVYRFVLRLTTVPRIIPPRSLSSLLSLRDRSLRTRMTNAIHRPSNPRYRIYNLSDECRGSADSLQFEEIGSNDETHWTWSDAGFRRRPISGRRV